ncbi:hypothetical protein PR202_ga06674 [Eleusine coracana subsp. coracana]|uniref:Uncharacterized protein n=1 Tax=Eleusine coracana subsp. coracana TaxID=191504 RepID=A0AAV5BWQ7_ELECO|nr:hypothetical protein PR202_ga06674 [Eleusine coracana subsp. coracana]
MLGCVHGSKHPQLGRPRPGAAVERPSEVITVERFSRRGPHRRRQRGDHTAAWWPETATVPASPVRAALQITFVRRPDNAN